MWHSRYYLIYWLFARVLVMKLCKCGNPIYDEPDLPSDKCYWCVMKEIADYWYKLGEESPKAYSGEGQAEIMIRQTAYELDKKNKK